MISIARNSDNLVTIDDEPVIDLMARYNLTPVQGSYIMQRGDGAYCCCAIGLMVIARVKDADMALKLLRRNFAATTADLPGLNPHKLAEFEAGWCLFYSHSDPPTELYTLGKLAYEQAMTQYLGR